MGSEHSDGEQRSRRRKHEDGGDSSSRKRRLHERDEPPRPRRRERSRSRCRSTSRRRDRRARSKTPDDTDKVERRTDRDRDVPKDRHRERSRSRDRDRRRDRDRSRSRDRKEDTDRDRTRRDGSTSRGHRHRRKPSPTSPKRIDYPSSRAQEDTTRSSRRRPSPSTSKELFSASRAPVRQSGPLPDQNAQFAVASGLEPEKPVEKPSFAPSGALAAASNAVTTASGETLVLKYHEPPEARKPPPKDRWKMFVFKGEDVVDTIELSHRSCWLVGRETAVVDLPAEHPSVSKQHAVIQFRYVEKRNEFGDRIGKVKPYLIDLESANGTVLNGDKVPESRYLELRSKDLVKFGLSTREYVFVLDRD